MAKPPKKNPAAAAPKRLGSVKGAVSRARKLSKKQRSVIAKKAALKRWEKKPKG